jgi:hypothetical protein
MPAFAEESKGCAAWNGLVADHCTGIEIEAHLSLSRAERSLFGPMFWLSASGAWPRFY